MQTPSNILRCLRSSEKLLFQLKNTPKYCRTYLSKVYHCEDEWNKRLNSSLLKQIKPSEMFFDIEKKYLKDSRISAVDIDIFANIILEDIHAEEIITFLQKLRFTTEASNLLPSTHHAVIRYFLKTNQIDYLLDILNDKLKYGIFPDSLCYNLLMDTFIEKEDFVSAAKVASLLMLQEDYDNPISNALALYSCHRYLEKPDEWKAPVIVKDEPEEEVKVRVRYIREPYFDDHFDLTEPSDLAGKTLAVYGKCTGNAEGRSCQLRGLILFKKYKEANKVIDQWIEENTPDIVYKEIIPLILKDVAQIFDGEMGEDIKKLKDLLDKLSSMQLKEGSLTDVLEGNIKKAIEKQEKVDISQQCKDYIEWEDKRMKILQEHLAELDRQQKKKQFEKTKKELEDKERLITFFDNEEEIELKIEEKLAWENKKYGHIPVQIDTNVEDYIPPEVKKRRQI